jgi:beta-N-acetylhexosaminidase
MTLEQKIGAMLMLGWEGDNPTDDTTVCAKAREIVEDMQVGGIILMGRNIRHDDLSVTANTINELQSMSAEPLLVNVDQEGGMVARFVDGVTVMPSNMALGATRRPDLAYSSAVASAEELRAIGVNYDFAPSVDVNNNPDNPIIGTRSYGESPDMVAEFGAQAIRGFQDAGVIACAKHFPGHGDTSVDSHLALPSVPYPRERLDEIELKPFRAAIEAGVSSIMTTHIMFPALDADLPSTLSRKIITGLLREEMGYDGVIVTDSMEMKAIADNWGVPEASLLAVEAGVDLVLIPHTLSAMRASREAILRAVKDGRISESRIDESVARLTALKRRYDLQNRRFADPNALGRLLRTPEHLAVQREIAELSVTLVRNEKGVVPLDLGARENVVVMGMHGAVAGLATAARTHWGSVEAIELKGGRDEVFEQAMTAASTAAAIIVPTCPSEPWKPPTDQALQTELVKALNGLGKKLVVIAVREPYDLRKFPEVGAYVCTYGYREASLDAAAALVFGGIEPRGTLPVTIS